MVSAANLHLYTAELDADLGAPAGLPFPPVSAGEALEVEMRVASTASALVSFEMEVYWSADHLAWESCVVGADWSGLWDCIADCTPDCVNPKNTAFAGGSNVASTVRRCKLDPNLKASSFKF